MSDPISALLDDAQTAADSRAAMDAAAALGEQWMHGAAGLRSAVVLMAATMVQRHVACDLGRHLDVSPQAVMLLLAQDFALMAELERGDV